MHVQYIHPHKYVTLVLVPTLRAGITLTVTKLMSFAFALNEIKKFAQALFLAKDKIESMTAFIMLRDVLYMCLSL